MSELDPREHMAMIAEAYTAPRPAPDIHDLLERAALEGRSEPPPPSLVDHEPVPPTMRCQVCGRRILEYVVGDTGVWIHDPDADDR